MFKHNMTHLNSPWRSIQDRQQKFFFFINEIELWTFFCQPIEIWFCYLLYLFWSSCRMKMVVYVDFFGPNTADALRMSGRVWWEWEGFRSDLRRRNCKMQESCMRPFISSGQGKRFFCLQKVVKKFISFSTCFEF